MTRDRFRELSLAASRRVLTQMEVFELLEALLEARPELSADQKGGDVTQTQ